MAEEDIDYDFILNQAYAYINSSVDSIKTYIGGSFGAIQTGVETLVASVGEWVATFVTTLVRSFDIHVRNVLDAINGLIGEASEYISEIISTITTLVQGAITQVGNFVDSLAASIGDGVSDLFAGIVDTATDITNSVVDSVSDLVSDASLFVEDTYTSIVEGVTSLTNSAVEGATEIYDNVAFAISETVAGVGGYLNDLAIGISGTVGDLITSGLDYTNELYNNVSQGVTDVLHGTNEIIKSFQTGIADFISATIDVAGQTLTELLGVIADLPEEIQNLAQQLIESASENIATPINNIAENIFQTLKNRFDSTSEVDEAKFMQMIDMVANPQKKTFGSVADLQNFIDTNMPLHSVLKGIVNVILTPFLMVSLMSGITQINAKNMMYEYALETPHELLTAPDLVDGLKRGNITQAKFDTDLKRLGYFPEDIITLAKLGRQLLPVAELISFWLRGLINETQLDGELLAHGIIDTDIASLKQAAFFIPGPQDLITMAVREVFSPAIAERFGQYEDFPPDFESWASKQGISKAWAERYWAAHWSLPSPQMGFAMLHRDIIPESDLTLLLKSLDIMPFWRDNLIKLSYNPLTRVDVRRMHKLGVLTYDEIIRAYKDIGYDERNATRLADFTVEYNKPADEADEVKLKELTRSNITRMYKAGILDRAISLDLLLGLNYSPESAELYLYEIDVTQELQLREETSDLIISQFKAGQLTFEQAQDQIANLGFEQIETQLLINKLVAIQTNKFKLPSLETLNKMIGAQIISADEYYNTVLSLGYSPDWSARLLKLQTG